MSLLRAPSDLHVLLAFDDERLREQAQRCLEPAAGTAPADVKLRAADTEEVDVVLVEVGERAGFELFRELRERYSGKPIVVLARDADAELAQVTSQHGADDLIYVAELDHPLLRRVLGYAQERFRLTRQLVAAREREAQLATHDSVTGLATRSLFFTCLTQAISFAERRHNGLAVAYLDVDQLQRINGRFGYTAGDRILGVIGERMQDTVRTSDMVSRLGGDEFVMLLRDINSEAAAGKALEGVYREMERPIYVAGHKVSITVRSGIALYPVNGEQAESLVTAARNAFTRAAAGGIEIATAADVPELAEAS